MKPGMGSKSWDCKLVLIACHYCSGAVLCLLAVDTCDNGTTCLQRAMIMAGMSDWESCRQHIER